VACVPTIRQRHALLATRKEDWPFTASQPCPHALQGRNEMRKFVKFVMVGLIAALALSLAAGASSARTRLEVSTTAALISGILIFEQEGSSTTVTCELTLHATLRRLINKIRGELIGHVTAVLFLNCRSNFSSARVVALVPLLIEFLSILGSLPNNIIGIFVLIRGGFLIDSFIRCLYFGTIPGEARENPMRSIRSDERTRIPLSRDLGGFPACERNGRLRGTLSVSPGITVRLLEA
jgi:hypothetical protein